MPRESKVITRLRELKVFNPYDFYQNQPYIYRRVSGGSRDVVPSSWNVVKRGTSLSDAWYDEGEMAFVYQGYSDVQNKLVEAQKWASVKFCIKEWMRDPFGSYGSKEYVERRLKELLK